MSKHHHHPNEGHGAGNPPRAGGHLRHNWFFYVSGVFLLIALLAFIFSGNLFWRPQVQAPPPQPVVSGK